MRIVWYNINMTKICTRCRQEKSFTDFGNRKDQKDGKDIYCKTCKNIFNNEWLSKPGNKDKQRVKSTERNRKWYHKNPIKKITSNNKWKINNKEQVAQYHHQYQQDNKEYIKDYQRNYVKSKKENDLLFKLRANLRSRQYAAIKNNQKTGSAIKDLGCTIKEFQIYLESLFYSNPDTGESMTWENWGRGKNKWQIDHIINLASIDISNREQYLKVSHYSNQRPLWGKQHLEKTKKESIGKHNSK